MTIHVLCIWCFESLKMTFTRKTTINNKNINNNNNNGKMTSNTVRGQNLQTAEKQKLDRKLDKFFHALFFLSSTRLN